MDENKKRKAIDAYVAHCKMFIKSGGSANVFGRLEGMQELATILGLGDLFAEVRGHYRSAFEKLVD